MIQGRKTRSRACITFSYDNSDTFSGSLGNEWTKISCLSQIKDYWWTQVQEVTEHTQNLSFIAMMGITARITWDITHWWTEDIYIYIYIYNIIRTYNSTNYNITSPYKWYFSTSYTRSEQKIWGAKDRCMIFTQVVSPEAFQIHDLRVIHIEVHLEEEGTSKDFRTSNARSQIS